VGEEDPERNDEQDRDEDELAVPPDQAEHEDSGRGKSPCILTLFE
jgi:hypothetical protein